MAVDSLPVLTLYARAGCGLCDESRAVLIALLDARAEAGLPRPTMVERDIEQDPELERALFDRIPVVELSGQRVELATSAAKLRRLLRDVLDA